MGSSIVSKSFNETDPAPGPESHKFEVYLYDAELIESEYDDPLSAVLFRHPAWLTDDHALLTAGQLAGVAHFFRDTIGSEPRSFQMERGRFLIHRCGRFLLFTGDTSSTLRDGGENEDDPVSRLQSQLLASISFYFGDLTSWHRMVGLQAHSQAIGDAFGRVAACFFKTLFDKSKIEENLFRKSSSTCKTASSLPRIPSGPCRRLVRCCHDHTSVIGCLVRISGQVVASTFSSSDTRCLLVLTPEARLAPLLLCRLIPYRLPVGTVLLKLANTKTGCNTSRIVNVDDEDSEKGDWKRSKSVSTSLDTTVTLPSSSGDASAPETDEEEPFSLRAICRRPDRDISIAKVVRKSAGQRQQRSERRRQTERRESEETVDLVRKMLFQRNSHLDKQAISLGKEHNEDGQVKMQSASSSRLWLYWQVLGSRELMVGLDKLPPESLMRDLWNLGLSKLSCTGLAPPPQPNGRVSGARKN